MKTLKKIITIASFIGIIITINVLLNIIQDAFINIGLLNAEDLDYIEVSSDYTTIDDQKYK